MWRSIPRSGAEASPSILYRDLFGTACDAGHSLITCEVNVDPPNPASDAFHAAQGFDEVGRQRLENGKTVRYLVHRLAED